MEKLVVTIDSFLKNAGLVGLKYLLDESDADENITYGITDDRQGIWIDQDFIKNADWTALYFQACIKRYGSMTNYQMVLDKIEQILDKAGREDQEMSAYKEDLKFINEKLLSNSMQSGFENIRHRIERPEVYDLLKKSKLKATMEAEQLYLRLRELQEFLKQPLCAEIFMMKCIIYSYINRFWDGKSFLLPANAKKDMKEMFDADFSDPFQNYILSDHEKDKNMCIDCGRLFRDKKKAGITFMKDQADDLTRKRSAFWNGKEDAYLCPVCSYLYALVPLGFTLIGNTFVFVNQNRDVTELFRANDVYKKAEYDAVREDQERYASWIARTINLMLQEKSKELGNIQVITRGLYENDRFTFDIVSKEVLKLCNEKKIRSNLNYLAQYPYVKIGKDYWNVHENVILNLLRYRNQYGILKKLMRLAIENDGIVPKAALVYEIQLQTNLIKKAEKNEKTGGGFMSRYTVREQGYELRTELLRVKQTDKDDCIRGTIYQLLNALSVGNVERFMEVIMRTYCSTKLQVPDAFIEFLRDRDTFTEYGYAFLLGLKGSHIVKKEEVTNE